MKLIDILVEELPKRGGWPKHANCITQDGDLRVEPAACNPSVAKCDEDGFWFLDSSRIGGFEVDTLASDYTTAIITREQYEAALSAKNDDWIDWAGGECPVPCGAMVDVRHRCGAVSENQQAWPKHRKESDVVVNPFSNAEQAFWRHENSVMDIIAYRPHQPQQAEQTEASEEDLNECIGQAPVAEWNGEGLIPPVGCVCERSWAGDEWLSCEILFTRNQIVVVELRESGREDAYNIGDVAFRPIRLEAERKRHEAAQELCYAGGGFGEVNEKSGCGSSWFGVYDAIAAGKIPGVKLED